MIVATPTSAAEVPQPQPAVTVHIAAAAESRQRPEPMAQRDTSVQFAIALQPSSPRALPLPDFRFAQIDEDASGAEAAIAFAARQLEKPGGEAALCEALLAAISAAEEFLTPALRSSTFDAAAKVCLEALWRGIAVESMIELLRRISAGTQLPSHQWALGRSQMKCALRYMAAIDYWTVDLDHASPAARDRRAVLHWALEHAAFVRSTCKSPLLRFAANADHLFQEPERSRFKAAVIRTSLVLDPRGTDHCRVGRESWTYPRWLIDGRRELRELSEGVRREQAQAAMDVPHKRKREEPVPAEPMSESEWLQFKREFENTASSVYAPPRILTEFTAEFE